MPSSATIHAKSSASSTTGYKTTSIYVTHDQVEAMGLGDRIVVMNAGKVRQVGTPEDIYTHPADTFVATFIGSPPMNLVEAGEAILGFRPETFLPRHAFPAGADAMHIPFRVRRVEYLGGDRLLYGRVTQVLPETEVLARIPSSVDYSPAEGEEVPFAVLKSELRYFDPQSGLAIESRNPPPLRSVSHG